jgi:hypothetical protein
MNEPQQSQPPQQNSSQEITDDFLQKYVPIEVYVAMKNIPKEKVLEMIREGSCVGYTKNNQWFVGRNELNGFKGSISLGNPQQKKKIVDSTEKPSSNGLLKLLRGEIGLTITFWIFGVLIGTLLFFLTITIGLIEEDLIMFFLSIWVGYQFIITIGVLRSCKYYQGEKIWPVLAIIVSLGFSALMGFIWLIFLSLSINGYAGN